ncbi:hypothetical protein BaRGS_00027373 [Batillaria attramentaria]|uniref:GOLD domain-containing protein n=1 Tax=Batillaria attramentaria TaxID=370345 RepID=A0ABD0K1Z5_9CAEN
MAASTDICRVLLACLLACKFVLLGGETVLGEVNEDFDFDGLPGVQHEFKVEIGAGREECFFQPVANGAKVHVSFEVLRGGDRNVDLILRDSQWTIINAHYWKNQGLIETDMVRPGMDTTSVCPSVCLNTIAVCIDNTFSRFAGKLVYLYFVSFVMADWSRYVQEITDINILAENFTVSLSVVEASINGIKNAQSQQRFHIISDWYLLTGNNKFVQNWSIAQCVVIIVASAVQVIFVRRLFRTTNVTPTAKPRA